MDAVIRKWGNSPAVRINAAAMKTAAFHTGQRVAIKASRGRIVIEPAEAPDLDLADLVAGIKPANRHEAIDTHGPLGKEVW